MFSKSLESALSAMALLAEAYDGGQTALTADQIAAARELNRPFVAKLLTALVAAGLVQSKPGRNGGFALARAPEQILLSEVAGAIGHRTRIQCCPFGPEFGADGARGHCALHEQVCALREQVNALLTSNTLASFTAPGGHASC